MSTLYIPNVGYTRLAKFMTDALTADSVAKLWQVPITLTPDTVSADFTEADFGGYSPITPLTFQPPILLGDLVARFKLSGIQFAADGSAPSNTCYGVWFEQADGTLIFAIEFDTPQSMGSAGDAIDVGLFCRYGACVSAIQ